MTVHLVTFSSANMDRSADLCMESAHKCGVGATSHYCPYWVTCQPFYEANREVFDAPRGSGYWAFKPAIILDVLERDPLATHIIYADAGIEFINNVSHIIDRMDQDIFLFGNQWEHAHWCKVDIIEEVIPPPMGKPYHRIRWEDFGKQAQASVIFFRVSDYTRQFVKEWLDWCLFEGGRLIDDSPSRTPNHPEFQENRHDQAILTTLAYREGIKLHWWGARYNMDQPNGGFVYPKSPEYASDDYEPFVHHHRKRNHEWSNAA